MEMLNATDEIAEPLFKSFEWVALQNQGESYDLLSDARDIAAGVAVALQMVERTNLNNENGDAPLLGLSDTTALTRLSIASMNLLRDRIDQQFTYMNRSFRAYEAAQQGEQA
jgi:hypothetical protein